MMELPPPMETVDICDGEQPRKLAILGLPWDTSDETLRLYFAQFGDLEHAEIMKDRYSGKSRGFGFVTFVEAAAAQQALLTDHTIDGRRCEAKIALPKGEPTPPRTTRIFVARVPPSVSEAQFRVYFEAFGKLQDAYMPRDHSKQGFRGIGFVTYACPESVEKVMAVKHWMHGNEIAIDRATPKDEPAISRNMMMTFQRPGGGNAQRRSFDNGAGIIGPGLTSVMQLNSGLSTIGEGPAEYPVLSSLSVDCDMLGERDIPLFQTPSMSNHDMSSEMPSLQSMGSNRWSGPIGQQDGQPPGATSPGMTPTDAAVRARQALGMTLGDMGLHRNAAAAAVAASAALQTLANVQSVAAAADNSSAYTAALTQLQGLSLSGLTDDQRAGLILSSINKATTAVRPGILQDIGHPTMQQYMAAHAASSNSRRSIDNSVINMSRRSIGENPAIATARAGPRIFIGKLTKDTSEADVKEYFMRFGYVMDVYLPKSKDNKAEHRGFGFVTFETEAAIQRVVSNGSHRLRGSTIAIDIAMPKVDEESEGNDSSGGRNSFDSVPFVSQPGNLNPALVGLGGPLPMIMAHNI